MNTRPTRKAIPQWEARQALAIALWERGTINAKFPGQMAEKLAELLDKSAAARIGGWDPKRALMIARTLEATGHLAIVGDMKVTEVRWIGQTDPRIIDWEPVRPEPEPKPEPLDEANLLLVARIERLERQVDRIPELVRQAVDLALEAWTQ